MLYGLYIASILGAASLVLLMPQRRLNLPILGALLGTTTLGGIWLYLATFMPEDLGLGRSAFAYYYVFSALAIGSAVRVITHTKPVYAALWFVMVVIASSGLLIVMSAEFIAFAMLIIYGGAILVTYMFVIMLASESGASRDPDHSPDYERFSREPLAACTAGFLLLALLLTVVFPPGGHPNSPLADAERQAHLTDERLLATTLDSERRPAARLMQRVSDSRQEQMNEALAASTELENVERVGLDLFRSHPLGLELAGVILLVALVGAVVIAKHPVEEEAPSS